MCSPVLPFVAADLRFKSKTKVSMDADCSLSKRSFAQVASATFPRLSRSGYNNCASIFSSLPHETGDLERISPFKRRSTSRSRAMPIQTSPPPVPDSFPSFMSVFGGVSPNFSEKEEDNGVINRPGISSHVPANSSKHLLPFQHRESVSSMTTGSTESSPTTTVSTFDSPSAADTSASSSPESPLSMPLSYSKFMPPARNIESQSLSAAQYNATRRASDVPLQKRPDSPGRRDRNLKNLSLRMPPPSQSRPPIATASVVETTSQHHLSAPPSPIQIPPKSSRRKPANLTIRTPAFDKSFSSNITEVAPPTPHGQPSLRHTESSPSLSVFSPSFGPKGGMQLPRPMTHHGARRLSCGVDEPLQTVADESKIAGEVLHEMDEDVPDSRESTRRNERGYPNGPIKIYDSGVFLYLEPTVQEASNFDVVVNVAQEVNNPFTNTNLKNDTVMSAWRNTSLNGKRLSGAEPHTAASEVSFKSAFEYPQTETPTAPKSDQSGPEYIHVGWDHNSEILDDLFPLCELIDTRISQGKKVLIHCQLGVSRSASLVIAYGLYKNRNLDFNTIYGMVKERSQWVGPNMSLIYQLTDFRSRLLRGSPSKPAREEWFVRGPRRSSEPQPPRAVASGQDIQNTDAGGHTSKVATQASASSLSVPSTDPGVPGAPGATEKTATPKSLAHKRSLSPRPLQLGQSFRSIEPTCRYMKSESNLQRQDGPFSSIRTDLYVRNAPEEPCGLFSPRTSGFFASSTLNLAEDGRNGNNVFGSPTADPRSPPPGNERLIMRNIDELL